MAVIDYVVPMVFHDDPEWRADYHSAGRVYNEENLADFVRYRSWGTERLLVRCIRRFMPFVRTIYIILARESQKRPWMDEEDVRVVYHREFIPEKFLPTFNSRTIEMFLKDIPDISELFVYGNDDMFPIAPLDEEDFFVDGVPCLHHTEKPFPSQPNDFHRAAMNGLNFVAGKFGREYTTSWLKGGHSITPMVRSTWEMLWKEYGKEMESSISVFREPKNFNQWLCPWWHHLSGNYVDRCPRRKYTGVRKPIEEVLHTILDEDIQVVCVNDNECEKEYMNYGMAVRGALDKRLEDAGPLIQEETNRSWLWRVLNSLR